MADFRIFDHDGAVFEDDDIAVHIITKANGLLQSSRGSFFIAVLRGHPNINDYELAPGMYASVPNFVAYNSHDPCRVLAVDAKRFVSIFSLGGPIEPQGRLRYIDGCTDTGLIAPFKLGDPCLNFLFFPPDTLQTAHTHPSHRIGAIVDGQGWCLTENGETRMEVGDVFIIPANALHWFKTYDSAMRIIVFHPDSEFGPTDELHQMREATLIPEPAQ